MSDLTLYYLPSCPFCRKVLNFLEENNIKVERKNTSESPEIRQELMQKGGKTQVPCLVIDDEPLYESDDIIQWLKQNAVAR